MGDASESQFNHSPICTICSKEIFSKITPLLRNDSPDPFATVEHSHTSTLSTLLRNAPNCSWCKEIIDALEEFKHLERLEDSTSTSLTVSLVIRHFWNVAPVGRYTVVLAVVEDGNAIVMRYYEMFFYDGTTPAISPEHADHIARKSLLHRAAQTMKDCQKNHTHCHPGGSFFPTRVIDVWADPTRESRVRLHEDKSTIAPYATLSYCWGGSQPLTTTSRTYQAHIEHGFEISDTPPTIQDAIATTRTIDAQKRGVLHFRQRLDPTFTRAEEKHRRAWTLQERLLSPRDLIFRDNSLVWQCRENDEMIFGEVYGSKTSGSDQLPLSLLSYNQDSDMPPGIQIGDVERVWGELLSDYGDRDLTNAEDKLIALAGITEEFHRVFRGRYLAGLWERNLPQELVWAIATPQPPMREYTAPSWSWASVKGKVMTFPWMIARDFEVLECQVDLATEQLPFGAVTGGYLKVKGVLREAKFDIVDQDLLPLLLPKKDQDECVEIGTLLLDALPDEILDGSITAQSRIRKRIWCLQVTWAVGPGSVGMALVPAHDHTFRRIGKFSAPGKKDWFSGSEEQIVIIE